MKSYCLGYTHEKCETCQNEKNWKMLNQMPNALRLSMQQGATKVNIDKCRMTGMGDYVSAGDGHDEVAP